MTTKLKPAERFLATHRRYCKVWLFSAQAERTCTCGRDALVKELEELRAVAMQMEVRQMELVMR